MRSEPEAELYPEAEGPVHQASGVEMGLGFRGLGV